MHHKPTVMRLFRAKHRSDLPTLVIILKESTDTLLLIKNFLMRRDENTICQNRYGIVIRWQNVHLQTAIRAVKLQIYSASTAEIAVHVQFFSTRTVITISRTK